VPRRAEPEPAGDNLDDLADLEDLMEGGERDPID